MTAVQMWIDAHAHSGFHVIVDNACAVIIEQPLL